jgi:hypothetical protein
MGFAKRSARHKASLGRRDITPKTIPVGAPEGCDLLIFGVCTDAKSQKIAGFGSSYGGRVHHEMNAVDHAKSIRRVLFTIVHCQSFNCSIVQSRLFISVQL